MRKTELKELYKMMFPDYPDILFRKAENSQTKLGHSLSRCYSSGAEIRNENRPCYAECGNESGSSEKE